MRTQPQALQPTPPSDPAAPARPDPLGAWWVLAIATLLMLGALGWRFVADPSLAAPTRDPAWYTWRANVVMQDDPGSIVREWGPNGLFSGGYRVTVPLEGALLQRVVGIDTYTFAKFLMLGVPILTGLALGAGAVRSRGDPVAFLTMLLATVALFLTTPYVGYLDNITVLFLLALMLPFLQAAKTSWGARTALFLIGIAAAFTHPTTCVLFGVTLLAVFGFHLVTSRFRLGSALRSDGPTLLSVGSGMVLGLACWVIGIWGPSASLKDAALPPPYTKAFFVDRLLDWIGSMQPLIVVPFIAIAIGSTVWLARTRREPADGFDVTAAWWLLPLVGAASMILGTADQVSGDPNSPVVPYYRFMNATAAPIALVGLGAFAVIRWARTHPDRRSLVRGFSVALGVIVVAWFVNGAALTQPQIDSWVFVIVSLAAVVGLLGAAFGSRDGIRRGIAIAAASVLVVGSLGFLLVDGLQHRWVSVANQYPNQSVRGSLAAVDVVAAAAGSRPLILVVNDTDANDSTGSNTAYGWAKTYTNVFRTGLPGTSAKYQATYLGSLQNFLAGEVTTSSEGSVGYDRAAQSHFGEVQKRLRDYPQPPAVFVVREYYGGLCNGEATCTPELEQQRLDAAMASGVAIGPDVAVVQGPGLWTPPPAVVAQANQVASETIAALENHPGPLANPAHTLLVIAILAFLLVVPGALAAPWFGLRTTVDRFALIPGTSVVLLLLSGIFTLAVWRGPLSTVKGWAVVGVAVGAGLAFRVADRWLSRPLESFGGFFDRMFAVFAVPSFAVLMAVQFMAQAGQGIVQGAIGKSIGFGGQKGFDVQDVPSADYLLKVVLWLYVPYTLLSPFIGVFIDRFPRRRVIWWTGLLTAGVVGVVALVALAPLGDRSSEGMVFDTVALILGLIAAQACVRVALAVKSAAMPDVLSGKDLLQGNALSQAGGALFQVVGIAIAVVGTSILASWVVVLGGAAVLVAAAFASRRMQHVEMTTHVTSFGYEARRVLRSVWAGLKEVAARPAAALGLTSFQMLRYQFWGFGLFVFALYAKNLVQGGVNKADSLALVLSGIGGLAGGALGLVLAQKLKDRVPPIRLLLASMFLLGAGTVVFGASVSKAGFAAMLFTGFFSFFLGKIASDTITQQAMPDDFRGRAFALYDIAYNLGFIVPAIILSFVWIEDDPARTRAILVVSGLLFLGLTTLIALWARRIRGDFAPQDDLPETQAGPIPAAD
ncbi:MAG TPA: MFS transporter [Actinomycetota bacterium]|nr:MFS transporter [Actinomycetota bacterium]